MGPLPPTRTVRQEVWPSLTNPLALAMSTADMLQASGFQTFLAAESQTLI